MQIQTDIMRRHMEEAAIEQLTAEYLGKGYSVVAAENGGGEADLVVKRGDERIYLHVRSTPRPRDAGERLRRLHQHVQGDRNARLQMVVVRPPKQPDIDVENFEGQLLRLCTKRLPSLGVSSLGSSVRAVRVSDVEFDAVTMRRDGTEVRGTAAAEFELDEVRRDTFTLSFRLVLGHDLGIAAVECLATDISSHAE